MSRSEWGYHLVRGLILLVIVAGIATIAARDCRHKAECEAIGGRTVNGEDGCYRIERIDTATPKAAPR